MRKSARYMAVVITVALVLVSCIWYAALREDRQGLLTVSFLDIGQGDAIFIDAPSGRQVLIDGGPPTGAVLRRLSDVMPWWDRSIDVVIPTHPDSDHLGGLIDVLKRYDVGMIVYSSVQGDTKTFAAFNKAEAAESAQKIVAMRGQVIALGDGAYLEVLSPDRLVPQVDTNDGCVVTRLVYGNTSFMLSCDAPGAVEDYLAALGTSTLRANVLKAGHHGSKTSSSPLFLGYVDPAYGVFSRGCGNKYGHPAQETVERFARFGIPTFDTCSNGTVTFISDGQAVRPKL
ncbi:MAG: MBL fold metallo-hydrolase [Candidatus Paceibacterota bacterium]